MLGTCSQIGWPLSQIAVSQSAQSNNDQLVPEVTTPGWPQNIWTSHSQLCTVNLTDRFAFRVNSQHGSNITLPLTATAVA